MSIDAQIDFDERSGRYHVVIHDTGARPTAHLQVSERVAVWAADDGRIAELVVDVPLDQPDRLDASTREVVSTLAGDALAERLTSGAASAPIDDATDAALRVVGRLAWALHRSPDGRQPSEALQVAEQLPRLLPMLHPPEANGRSSGVERRLGRTTTVDRLTMRHGIWEDVPAPSATTGDVRAGVVSLPPHVGRLEGLDVDAPLRLLWDADHSTLTCRATTTGTGARDHGHWLRIWDERTGELLALAVMTSGGEATTPLALEGRGLADLYIDVDADALRPAGSRIDRTRRRATALTEVAVDLEEDGDASGAMSAWEAAAAAWTDAGDGERAVACRDEVARLALGSPSASATRPQSLPRAGWHVLLLVLAVLALVVLVAAQLGR